MAEAAQFNPSHHSFAELYRTLGEIRRDEPIFWSDRYQAWVVTRYDDVVKVVRNNDAFSVKGVLEAAQPGGGYCPAARAVLSRGVDWMVTGHLQSDEGPSHSRFRSAVLSVITPKRIRDMEPAVRDIINSLIDTLHPRGECDFAKEFAYPLAMLTTLRLIGFKEAEDDLDRFPLWADDTFKLILKSMTPEEQVVAATHAVEFQDYIRAKIEDRRANPRDDMMSEIVNHLATGKAQLTDDELIIMFTQTFVGAGQETTKLGLTNMMLHVLEDPAQWEAVKANPDKLDNFVEESLRYDPPLLGLFRVCVEDTVVGGVEIKEGQRVFFLLGSGNHDDEKYADADSFRPFRAETIPHLTFNTGQHFCVGAGLARLEMRTALEILSKRLPSLRLKAGVPISYESNDASRFLSGLQVEWDVEEKEARA